MRRIPSFQTLWLIPVFALVFLVGCPSPSKVEKKFAGPPKGIGKLEGPNDQEITADTDGTIKGIVKFKGIAPEPKPIDAVKLSKEAKDCLAGGGWHIVEQVWLIKDGKVANVAVWLAPPPGKKFKITEALKKPFEQPVVMDQPYCAYVPHVTAVYAGIQPFIVKNSSELQHCVAVTGRRNPSSLHHLPPGTDAHTPAYKYEYEEHPINIACPIHTWMSAKLLTFDHPYFAVSKEDGSFEIKNAPVGEELTIWLWHEGTGKVESQKITAKKGDNTIDLEISGK